MLVMFYMQSTYIYICFNRLVVYVNGDLFSTGISLTDNTWHFICVTWMSKEGYYEVYLDGFIKQFGYSLNRGGQIEANGTLMIGQEQVSYAYV